MSLNDSSINSTTAKSAFEMAYLEGKLPELSQVSDRDELSGVAGRVIAANPKPVADFRGGKDSALKALVGLMMRETRGRANPQLVEQLLRDELTKNG